jgi:hypothetical protein
MKHRQDESSELEKQTIPEDPTIIINPSILCLLSPLPARCNPCKYDQPLKNITCGVGTQKCAANGGTCKFNQYDRAFCCPQEHAGCCPPIPSPPVILPIPPAKCIDRCTTDAQCKDYQKCCGDCRRCVNATLT